MKRFALLAAVALLASACGPGARLGPLQDMPFSGAELARAVDSRHGRVESVGAPDVRVGYSGPLWGPIRFTRFDAAIMISGRDLMRLQVKHVMGDLGHVVLNGDSFVVANLARSEAYKGSVAELVDELMPGSGFLPAFFSPRLLFFPFIEPQPGERAVLIFGKRDYTIEYRRDGRRHPTRRVTLDAWSQAPLSAQFFDDAGRQVVSVAWSKFRHLPDLGIVAAMEATVRFPLWANRTFRFDLGDPGLNGGIRPAAFALRVPPGLEVKEMARAGERACPASSSGSSDSD